MISINEALKLIKQIQDEFTIMMEFTPKDSSPFAVGGPPTGVPDGDYTVMINASVELVTVKGGMIKNDDFEWPIDLEPTRDRVARALEEYTKITVAKG